MTTPQESAPAPPPPTRPVELDAIAPDTRPYSFIGGIAGTGKSFLSRAWEASDPVGVQLVATTGIAAVNLGGATINSMLGYFDTASLREAYLAGYLGTRIKRLMRNGIRRFVCDEVSMMDADQLTILVEAIDAVNEQCRAGRGGEGLTTTDQFGLTLVGDFCQLPPVKAAFAFTSPHWSHFAENRLVLTQIRRQSDRVFIEALHAVRRGEVTPDVCNVFAPAMTRELDHHFDGTTLVATNEEVERINRLRYLELTGTEREYVTTRIGEQRSEWKKNIPDVLRLRNDALVMLLANNVREYDEGIPVDYAYVNGDLGHVVDVGESRVQLVRDDSTPCVEWVTRESWNPEASDKLKARWRNGDCSENELEWKREEPTGNLVKVPKLMLGSVTYMPVRLAYATTCHKAQGLSFDRVQVTLKDPFWGSPAMCYVALSRVRTLEGLRLVATPEWLTKRAKVDPKVRAWL